MTELRSDWMNTFNYMQQEMERLLNHLGSSKPPAVRFGPRVWGPSIDIYETEKEIVVLVELAGINQDQINVMAERANLVIRGERKDISSHEHKAYHQMEINIGHFRRGVVLPAPVDPEQARASYKDGLLEIVLPKIQLDHNMQVKIV